MSSTNKTDKLGLNKWIGTDIPSRTDFVNDNVKIDKAISDHVGDTSSHVTDNERAVWNDPYYITYFSGDGTSSRIVTTECPFEATWGIIFSNANPPSVVDIANGANYNYFAIFSRSGSMTGVSLNGDKNIKVNQSSTASMGNEYRSYNQNGIVYVVILFR